MERQIERDAANEFELARDIDENEPVEQVDWEIDGFGVDHLDEMIAALDLDDEGTLPPARLEDEGDW